MEWRKELGILKRENGVGVGWPLYLWHMAWIYVNVCGERRHSIVNILDDDSDYTMEMMRRTRRAKGAKRGTLLWTRRLKRKLGVHTKEQTTHL